MIKLIFRPFFLSILLFVTTADYSQNKMTPEHIDSLLRKSKNGKGKHIINYKVEPFENFGYNKKSNNLFYFDLYYPDYKYNSGKYSYRYIQFFTLNNQLVKIYLNKKEVDKRRYRNYYYFNNDTLVYKKEYNVSQDISELQKLFYQYKAKGENLKQQKFK